MTSQVALVYTIQAVGPTSLNQLLAATEAVPIPYSDLNQLGVTLVSDVSVIASPNVTRTITYSLLPPLTVPAPQTAPGTFQGSIVSSSPEDAFPLGTGATQIRIDYLDQQGLPHIENVRLNGTTPVNLVLQDKDTILSLTPTGTPAGLISLVSGLYGTGLLIAQILGNFQGSIVSSSANDSATGIGAQTVTITYHDMLGAGPFTETVTLNGTTPVNLPNLNAATIDSVVVSTFGSYGSSTGTISIFSGIGKTGALVAYLSASFFQYFPPEMTVNAGLACGQNNLNSQGLFCVTTTPPLATIGTVVPSDLGSPFRGIYKHILGGFLKSVVSAAEPVFS